VVNYIDGGVALLSGSFISILDGSISVSGSAAGLYQFCIFVNPMDKETSMAAWYTDYPAARESLNRYFATMKFGSTRVVDGSGAVPTPNVAPA
jgi:hypothetical protein